MRWIHFNWQKLFSYGEVICFISAWGVALVMAAANQPSIEDRSATRNFVIHDEAIGIQAMRR